ncbi:MAG: ABC transporter permease [Bdellovibrionota bacterium]
MLSASNTLFWALKSIWVRRALYLWVLVSFALSSALIFFSLQFRNSVQKSFSGGASGVDLVIGAKTSEFNLVMFSLFNLGLPTANITLEDFILLEDSKDVEWAIPLVKGDSFKSFSVIGTNEKFFEHFRDASKNPLKMSEGDWFSLEVEAVLGAEVAKATGLKLGEEVIVSHGLQNQSIEDHHDHPFQVIGILEPTGTAADRSVFVDLRAMGDLHGQSSENLSISSALVKMKSRATILNFRNRINSESSSQLVAAMPGQVLQEFWKSFRFLPEAINLLAIIVLIIAFSSFFTLLMLLLRMRRQEIAIFKSLGMSRFSLMILFMSESTLVCLLGAFVGWLIQNFFFLSVLAWVKNEWGFVFNFEISFMQDFMILISIAVLGALGGLLPFILRSKETIGMELQSPS